MADVIPYTSGKATTKKRSANIITTGFTVVAVFFALYLAKVCWSMLDIWKIVGKSVYFIKISYFQIRSCMITRVRGYHLHILTLLYCSIYEHFRVFKNIVRIF